MSGSCWHCWMKRCGSENQMMQANRLSAARIVIVDDEPANVRLLERILQHAGYTDLTSTTDPREALALCKETEPDLILLDLHMPHVDGFAVMAELRPLLVDDNYLPGPAAELRDDATGEHTRRVGETAAALAGALGLPAAEVELIGRAAPLHDVGKIGIPDAILLKPGRLTIEEFEIMKTHTTIGAEILAGSRFPLLQLAQES